MNRALPIWRVLLCLALVSPLAAVLVKAPAAARVAAQLDPDQVAAATVLIEALVVQVEDGEPVAEYRRVPLGSGVLVSADGLILTNSHVVDLTALTNDIETEENTQGFDLSIVDAFVISVVDGLNDIPTPRYSARLRVDAPNRDIAVLKIIGDERGLPLSRPVGEERAPVPLAPPGPISSRAVVTVFGYPVFGRAAFAEATSETIDVVSGEVRSLVTGVGIGNILLMRIDATVSRGSSGGAVVDETGRLVGVITEAQEAAAGGSVAVAIPIDRARPVLEEAGWVEATLVAIPTDTPTPMPPTLTPSPTNTPETFSPTPTPAGALTPTPPPISLPTADYQDEFAAAVTQMATEAAIAGPTAGQLVESTPGTVPTTGYDLSLTDFMTEATITNSDATAALSDVGFRFHLGESRTDVILDSRGDVYVSVQGAVAQLVGNAASYDRAAGARNTLQLSVAAGVGLFGVNQQLVAAFELGDATPAGDVLLGSAFFAEDFVQDRTTDYQDFRVWDLQGALAVMSTPTTVPTSTSTPTATAPLTVAPASMSLPLANYQNAFAEALTAMDTVAPIAGPAAGVLTEATPGQVALTTSDLAVTDFMASVNYTNPDTAAGPSDAGFRFHSQGDRRNDIVLDSSGNIFVYTLSGASQHVGSAPAYDAAPGAENTLDLVVDSNVALFGVNGVLAAAVDFGSDVAPGNVRFGTGFYNDDFVQDRDTTYLDLRVWDLATPLAATSTPTPTATVPPTPTLEPLGLPVADYQDLFNSRLAQITSQPPAAGPLQGSLIDADVNSVPVSGAGVSLADFVASAIFINPDTAAGRASMGFQFWSDGTQVNRIVIDTNGTISAVAPSPNVQTIATATGFDPAAGARNRLQLIVEGDVALLGVNGELAAAILLVAPPVASDVAVGTSFFNENFVQDRVTEYEDFRVWALDGAAPASTPAPTSTPRPTSTPVHSFTPLRTATPVPTPTPGQRLAIYPLAEHESAFAAALADTSALTPVAGPTAGELVESTVGSTPIYRSGATLSDFVATATFVQPETAAGPSDAGFQFHEAGDIRNQIVVDSLGGVYAIINGVPQGKVGDSSTYDATPGARNTLQIVVDGNLALFGVNGELAAALELAPNPTASNVLIGAAFYREDFVLDRVTEFEDFSVWEFPG